MNSPFDSEKYESLLEGLEITVLPLSKIDLTDRADPEYYTKENLSVEQDLRAHNAPILSKFCDTVASAFYPAATELYQFGDIPFARCVDCINYPVVSDLQDDTFERIPGWFVEQNSSIQCASKNDIIMTKVGTPCYASIVYDDINIALSRTVLGLVGIHDINPYYLTAFLRSRYGFSQLMRQRELTIQYQLTLDRVRNILVYQASPALQEAVSSLMLQHIQLKKYALSKEQAAEKFLLSALSLSDWRHSQELTYENSFSEIITANRMDAEYFDPSTLSLIEHLKRYGSQLLITHADVKSGFAWSSEQFIEDPLEPGEPFVRIRDCKPGALDPKDLDKLEANYANSQGQHKALAGDLVLGMDGLRWFYASLLVEPCYVNQRVAQIQRHEDCKVSSEYLLVCINCLTGQKQLLRDMTIAHTVGHITANDIRLLLIPEVPGPVHDMITDAICESNLAHKKSRELFERAKNAIEISVEQSDSIAINFICEG